MKRSLYRIYQLCVATPLILLATILTSVVTCVGCFVGSAHFWGYSPGKYWSIFILRVLLLPVKVSGRELLDRNTSYIFVINHQSAIDIFVIYGFICRNFKWMMKSTLRRMPFVGIACAKARHIFVDRSNSSGMRETISQARETLQGGTSLVVFPEGSRTYTGRLGKFKKGAYLLAADLQLPIVPVTLNGPFDVLPRTRGINFVERHPLHMIIHEPIYPQNNRPEELQRLIRLSEEAIERDLPLKYQRPKAPVAE